VPARSQVRILVFSEILVTYAATAILALAFEEQDAGSGATPKQERLQRLRKAEYVHSP